MDFKRGFKGQYLCFASLKLVLLIAPLVLGMLRISEADVQLLRKKQTDYQTGNPTSAENSVF